MLCPRRCPTIPGMKTTPRTLGVSLGGAITALSSLVILWRSMLSIRLLNNIAAGISVGPEQPNDVALHLSATLNIAKTGASVALVGVALMLVSHFVGRRKETLYQPGRSGVPPYLG